MPQTKRYLSRHDFRLCCGALLALAIGLAGFGAAAESYSKPASPAATVTMNLQGLKSSHNYTPALGESLERIVAKTMPESPLNAQVLGQAFVLLNPQAFSRIKPQRTLNTASLKVPNHNQLLQLVLARNPSAVSPASASDAQTVKAGLPATRPPEKRENWVRYAGGPLKNPANLEGGASQRSGWVHYLGIALTRSWSGDATNRAETRAWVQYPSLSHTVATQTEANADSSKWVQYPSVARVNPEATAPESRLDTGTWVRFVSNRLYPQQQLAQLFD
jgi:hypothetical protein